MAFNIGNRPLRIAAFIGHADASGGNAFETALNRKVADAVIALAAKSNGFDIRYAPMPTTSTHPGALDDIVYDYLHNKWMKAGWLPDIVFSNHHEGGAAGADGVFFIYPDSVGLSGRKVNGDFVDTDVKAHAGTMATILGAAVGMDTRYHPPRGMSERETGVGGQGWRLGFFGALSDSHFQNNCCVFISECGNYSNAGDLAKMKAADFPAKQARGLLEAIASLAKERGNWTFNYRIGGSTPAPTGRPFEIRFEDGLPIRQAPGFSPTVIKWLPKGTKGVITEGPKSVDGMNWFNVTIDGFGTGWIPQGILWGITLL